MPINEAWLRTALETIANKHRDIDSENESDLIELKEENSNEI